MHVDQSDASPHQAVPFDKEQDLIIIDLGRMRQCMEQGDDFFSILDIPTRKFPHDERMDSDLLSL